MKSHHFADTKRGVVSDYETDSEGPLASFSNHGETSPRRKNRKRQKLEHASDGSDAVKSQTIQVDIDNTGLLHPVSSHVIQSSGAIQFALLQWYSGVHDSRGMPWRKPYNPSQGPEECAQRAYEVWVSEIMLQQTQVNTVIPYYNRWMRQFPTIRNLAGATIDEVNALWKGLGYYSRASRLLAGAQKTVKYYNGRLPDNAKDMEANIPGIGRYSAGAICSIAYGERVPVLDGNVHRLLSRFLALHAPPKAKATLNILWAAAAALVMPDETSSVKSQLSNSVSATTMESTRYPGDINQALIELGSTICKVREPDCKICPIRTWCRANIISESGGLGPPADAPDIEDICTLCELLPEDRAVTSYPMKVKRKKAREELDIVHVIEWRSDEKSGERWFLLSKRPEGVLLGGLYEFPTSVNVSKAASKSTVAKMLKELLSRLLLPAVLHRDVKMNEPLGADILQIKSIRPVGDVIHVFSHIKKTYRAQWIVLGGGKTPPPLKPSDIGRSGKKTKPRMEGLISGGDDEISAPLLSTGIIWTRLEDVSNANMGTGVVKVWNLTKDLWEREISGS